jgi:hypothetical protein
MALGPRSVAFSGIGEVCDAHETIALYFTLSENPEFWQDEAKNLNIVR